MTLRSSLASRPSPFAPRLSLLAFRSSPFAPRLSLLAFRSSPFAPRLSLLAFRSSPFAPRLSLLAFRSSAQTHPHATPLPSFPRKRESIFASGKRQNGFPLSRE